jgi:putative oxidoreductase
MATLTSSHSGFALNADDAALTPFQNAILLLGRILIALLFVPTGWGKLTGFSGTVAYIAKAGAPLPEVDAAIGIFCELILGLCLLLGFRTRWAALGLAIFVVVITPIFHHYWDIPAAMVGMQKLNFFKNWAITGGLLAFAAFGGGAFGVDGRKRV